jgi:hypothetical protein
MYGLQACIERGLGQLGDNKTWHWKDILTTVRIGLDRQPTHWSAVESVSIGPADYPPIDKRHRPFADSGIMPCLTSESLYGA